MDSKSEEQVLSSEQKMSLLSQFDDIFRFGNSLVNVDDQKFIDLLKKCEENRIKWLISKMELAHGFNREDMFDQHNKDLAVKLKDVRFQLGKEVQSREELLKQRNLLKNQLNAIKEFVLSEPTTGPQETRDRVLSFINLSQLDSILNRTFLQSKTRLNDVTEDNQTINSKVEESVPSLPKNSDETELNCLANTTLSRELLAPRFSLNLEDKPEVNNLNTITRTYSQKIPNKSQNRRHFPEAVAPNLSQLLSMTPLDERQHKLHQKKAFKIIHCGPCRQTIGFFGAFLCCEECRSVCHTKCKDKLALPCIPFRRPNGKSSQLVLIADFVSFTRPYIPALIVHCCKEIERRGLQEEGIYRKCGSDKDIKELKDKILKSKRGTPALANVDIHVLCGVVKKFLRDLDEPIVTRILWRDFVRASDQENCEQESALIIKTLEELITINRDSLAFIMTHLNKVVAEEDNKMDKWSLAKIFGPTIVGHSSLNPMMDQILSENPKQIQVMEALFRVPEDYWKEILTTDETQRYSSPDRRKSNINRFSGVSHRGSLTPMRGSSSKGGLSLKPLF